MADEAKPNVGDMSDAELGADVERAVRQFLKDEGEAPEALEMPDDQPLWAEFDSLLVMELLVRLEERYGVAVNPGKLDPEDLKTIARVRDLAVRSIRAAKKA
jgi:acyl carrier protein